MRFEKEVTTEKYYPFADVRKFARIYKARPVIRDVYKYLGFIFLRIVSGWKKIFAESVRYFFASTRCTRLIAYLKVV